MEFDLGETAQWATIFSAGVALLALLTAIAVAALNWRALRSAFSDRTFSDSRHVAAWWTKETVRANSQSTEVPVIKVRNAGDTPMYSCKVRVGAAGEGPEELFEYQCLPPGETFTESLQDKSALNERPALIEVAFTDPLGTRWCRVHDGRVNRPHKFKDLSSPCGECE
jgi:hypothetical protein